MKLNKPTTILAMLAFVAALVLAVAWLRPRNDKIIIRVLDGTTGRPVTNVTLHVKRHYSLPVLSSLALLPNSVRRMIGLDDYDERIFHACGSGDRWVLVFGLQFARDARRQADGSSFCVWSN